jgi:hypothetical protein
MSSLEVLLLDNNYMVGTIPPQLAQLRKLKRLNLAAQGEAEIVFLLFLGLEVGLFPGYMLMGAAFACLDAPKRRQSTTVLAAIHFGSLPHEPSPARDVLCCPCTPPHVLHIPASADVPAVVHCPHTPSPCSLCHGQPSNRTLHASMLSSCTSAPACPAAHTFCPAAFVTVDPRNRSLPGGAVSLEGLGLVGTIPSALFDLPDLIELNLEVNQLEGQLPDPLCGPDTKLEVGAVCNTRFCT